MNPAYKSALTTNKHLTEFRNYQGCFSNITTLEITVSLYSSPGQDEPPGVRDAALHAVVEAGVND